MNYFIIRWWTNALTIFIPTNFGRIVFIRALISYANKRTFLSIDDEWTHHIVCPGPYDLTGVKLKHGYCQKFPETDHQHELVFEWPPICYASRLFFGYLVCSSILPRCALLEWTRFNISASQNENLVLPFEIFVRYIDDALSLNNSNIPD